jgi:integrase
MAEEENREGGKMNRPKGTGCIYERAGSSVLWLKYSRNGKAIYESSHTTNRRKAGKLLRQRLGEIGAGTFLGPQLERIMVEELAEDFLSEYRANGRRSIGNAEARWLLHLKPFFGVYRATQVTTPLLNRYIESRQQQGAKNATCNRELAALKRMFNLGRRNEKVRNVPVFPRLREDNVRKGFLKDEDYDKLAAECTKVGLWLRALLAVAYNFGWRKSELLNLRVSQIELATRTIRLEVGETKNDAGRTVKMTTEVFTLLSACVSGKKPDDYVFTREDGKPVRDFRKTWRKVSNAVGVAGLLLHHLRRSGVRNLRRLGVAESVAMKISGHKTASVFRRYDITDEADLADAAARLDAKREQHVTQDGYNIGDSDIKNGNVEKTKPVN